MNGSLSDSGVCTPVEREPMRRQSGQQSSELFDDVFLQPWFLNGAKASAIRRLLPKNFQSRMRFYFDDWGCMICGTKRGLHMSNGMCRRCVDRVRRRLLSSLERRGSEKIEHLSPDRMTGEERVRYAQTLLSDLVKSDWKPPRMKLRRMKSAD